MNDAAEAHDPTLDPWGDQAAADNVEKAKLAALHDAIESNRFWQGLLADRRGRREIYKLVAEQLHAFEDRFVSGPTGFPDPNATWFAAGAQAAGLRIYQRLLMLDPVAVATMHAENDPRWQLAKAAAAPAEGES